MLSFTAMKRPQATSFRIDKRRKHHHFKVTVYYGDGERFARVYTDREKAEKFAEREKRSPVVNQVRITQVS
jgi:hypothetical protein